MAAKTAVLRVRGVRSSFSAGNVRLEAQNTRDVNMRNRHPVRVRTRLVHRIEMLPQNDPKASPRALRQRHRHPGHRDSVTGQRKMPEPHSSGLRQQPPADSAAGP
ncbi:hypothetical protein NDU88_002609 [Pleurodeles waltl]|uniref:Uncharacterized protein n=1 Tax=Pleurodeles waltl TaxID=8319 RepID=A0AAV7Q6H5_PLEWA|nr:hypothetical protein NDU88_002609 [Pleurodeles waltl]